MFQPRHITLYVPCYNANATIEHCLDSLLKQTIKVDSLFLVDDGSTHKLPDLPVKIIQHPENLGLASARNTALKHCQTPLIASVDSDVIAEPDWLEKLLARVNKRDVVGAAGQMDEFYKDDIGDRWRAKHMAQHWGGDSLVNPRFLFGANTLMIAEELRKSGGFDTRCRTNNEDRTMCEFIFQRDLNLAYEPSARCSHLRRDSAESILSSYWGWHHAKGLVEGDFDSSEGVIGRIRKVNFGIADYRYNMDLEDGKDEFAILDLLIPIVFAACDLRLYSQRSKVEMPSLEPLIDYLGLAYDKLKFFIEDGEVLEKESWFSAYEATFKSCCEEFMIKERLAHLDVNTWFKENMKVMGEVN
ncbi:MAG: glycosyltransferase family 2 protein [Lentisphaerales bacterium]|nr:glycosyltransferase family 2 protein [Lentisphaerales bacterium]